MAYISALAQSISRQLGENKMLEEQIKNVHNYQERRNQLFSIVEKLDSLHQKAILFQHEFNFELHLPQLPKILVETKALNERYAQNESIIIDIGDAYFKYWDQLIEDYQKAIEDRWNLYKQEHIFQINETVLRLLESFRVFEQDLEKVKTEKKRLDIQLGKMPPDNEMKWKAIHELNRNLRQTWDGLQLDSLPESILDFIKKAQLEGVSLDNYTPEVRNWLEENKLKKYFRIKLLPKAIQ